VQTKERKQNNQELGKSTKLYLYLQIDHHGMYKFMALG